VRLDYFVQLKTNISVHVISKYVRVGSMILETSCGFVTVAYDLERSLRVISDTETSISVIHIGNVYPVRYNN